MISKLNITQIIDIKHENLFLDKEDDLSIITDVINQTQIYLEEHNGLEYQIQDDINNLHGIINEDNTAYIYILDLSYEKSMNKIIKFDIDKSFTVEQLNILIDYVKFMMVTAITQEMLKDCKTIKITEEEF